METILGIVCLICLLALVIKVCISSGNSENKSLMELLNDTLHDENFKHKSQKHNNSVLENDTSFYPSMNNTSSDILFNSPYYNKYKMTFDYIHYHGREPKYRIDWLLKSLDMGHELEHDGVFVIESIKRNFPYFCETLEEFESITKDDCLVLKGSVSAIFILGYLYLEGNKECFHSEKRNYWRNVILEMAKEGNLDAQAGLCRRNSLFTDQEVEAYKEKYERELLKLAGEENPYAQLAVGQFIARNRKEKMEWLNKAAEQGLGDAYCYLAKECILMRLWDDEFHHRENPLSEKEEKLIDEKTGEYYLKAAKLNNGIMKVECQSTVANAYRYGYYGFNKDIVRARYWYEIAFKNGNEYSGRCIEEIDKWGE